MMNNPSPSQKEKFKRIKTHIHSIRKQFECPICIDFFETPMVTNCQHAFCKNCIESHIGNKRQQSCPMCKKNINLRSLSKFPQLETWVTKAKNLIDSFNKELGIEKLDETLNTISANTSLAQTNTKIEFDPKKRKRSTSDELKTSKKRKSHEALESSGSTAITAKKPTSKKKKSTATTVSNNNEATSSKMENDMAKVNEWLANNEQANPFNGTSSKQIYSCEDLANQSSDTNVDIHSASLSEAKNTNSNREHEAGPAQQQKLQTNSKKVDNPLSFEQNLEETGTNNVTTTKNTNKIPLVFKSSLKKKLTPRLMFNNFTKSSKFLKHLKFSKDSKLTPKSQQQTQQQEPTEPPEIIVFEEPVVQSKNVKETTSSTSSCHQEQKPVRPHLKKIREKIWLKEKRKTIKFYYCGSTISHDPVPNGIQQASPTRRTTEAQESFLKQKTSVKDNSMNTVSCFGSMRDASTQTSSIEEQFDEALDYLQPQFIEFIFQEIEFNLAREMVDEQIGQSTEINPNTTKAILNTPPSTNQDTPKVILATPQQTKPRQAQTDELAAEKTIITDSCVIPNTMPGQVFHKPQIWMIPDTAPIATPKTSNNNLNQFAELLESARNNGDKKSRKSILKRDRLPTLEFLNTSNNVNISIKETDFNYPAAPSTPISKRDLMDPAKRFLAQNKLVVVDTPQKDEETSLSSFRELNYTLHKSASRAEFVDSRVLENTCGSSRFSFDVTGNRTRYSGVDNTMPYDHTDINETTFGEEDAKQDDQSKVDVEDKTGRVDLETDPITFRKPTITEPIETINEKESTFPSLDIENTKENSTNNQIVTKVASPTSGKQPLRTPFANKSNHSLLLDSMDINDQSVANMTNNQPMTATAAVATSHMNNKLPPPAADILGTSYAGSIADSMSIMPTDDASVFNVTGATSGRKSQQFQSKKDVDDVVFKVPQSDALGNPSNNDMKSKPDSLETQLLTDSELFVIDNLCKDMYSVHNQTIDGNCSILESCHASALDKRQEHKIEFVCSLLKPDKKDLLKRFAKFIKATVADDVTESTTHLVVDSTKDLVCGVTSKYLKAISRKVWIVSILWVLACVKHGKLLDPSAFEITGDGIFGQHGGPKLGRIRTKGLFEDYEFLFIGKFESESINLDVMKRLSKLNGGIIVQKAKNFSEEKIRTVLFDEKVQKISVANANYMLTSARIFTVTTSWLLDSLACYALRDMKQYALYKED